jgi:hypothetical protein
MRQAQEKFNDFWKLMDTTLDMCREHEKGLGEKERGEVETAKKGGGRKKKKGRERDGEKKSWLCSQIDEVLKGIPRQWTVLVHDPSVCRDALGKKKVQQALNHASQCARLVQLVITTPAVRGGGQGTPYWTGAGGRCRVPECGAFSPRVCHQ